MIASHGAAEATLWHQNLQRTAVWSAALRSFCPSPCFCGFDTVWAEFDPLRPLDHAPPQWQLLGCSGHSEVGRNPRTPTG